MVIAAGGDEERTRIAADRDVEAERARVEGLGRRQVADVEVNVPDARAGRHGRLGVLAAELAQDAIEVERKRVHLQDSVADRPLLPRAVAIELDPVALRIAQVEGLADQVVGRAAEPPARLGDPLQGAGEVGAARHDDRQVKEAACATGAVSERRGCRTAR